ncbi:MULTISPECIES: hypothetical protein [unclassified Streptomyces]|uniref:hypothetical protein n=1 Tax=unclassified Streptomyces TaxID=2593676 RepID=UPI00344E447A
MSTTTTRKHFRWRGLHVPYIAPWTAETTLPGQIVRLAGVGGTGIGYADEQPHDRRMGILWTRQSLARGRGTPDLGGMHSLRQRQAVTHMLCGVCGASTFDSDFARAGVSGICTSRGPRKAARSRRGSAR